jgi:O-antigen/teichoic acid export membrane protein
MLTLGLAVARILGLAFSLVLARLLQPDLYGYIQYTIALAGVLALGTQPFGQHMFARLIGKYREDLDQFQRYINSAWFVLGGVFALTLIVATPILFATDHFSIGLIAVYVGLTVFYTYYGMARGFLDNRRLLTAVMMSNLAQIVLILFVYLVLGSKSPLPALLIYGGTYVLPALLLVYSPFPLRVLRLRRPDWPIVRELVRLSVPLWVSQACYALFIALDLLLLEANVPPAEVGVYALARTLATGFTLITMGINTTLLPRIAGAPKEQHGRLLRQALTYHLAASLTVLFLYAFVYNPIVGLVFGAQYQVGPEVYLLLALGQVIGQTHTVISSAMVGSDRAALDTYSLILLVSVTLVAGLILVPAYGAGGAALTFCIGTITGIAFYIVVSVVGRLRKT